MYDDLSPDELNATGEGKARAGRRRLADAQELLWASDTYALLVVFQAIDAAGKDSTIKHVMSGVNPQGVEVVSFKKPSSEELDHDVPVADLQGRAGAGPDRDLQPVALRGGRRAAGAPRVARAARGFPPGERDAGVLGASATTTSTTSSATSPATGLEVVKFFLHVSKAEQKRRFLARLDNPDKMWKFNAADVAERAPGTTTCGVRPGDHGDVDRRGRRGS